MAGIDKIYMNELEAQEFWDWCFKHQERCEDITGGNLTSYFSRMTEGYVVNFPEIVDWYLWYCDDLPQFVRNRLEEQYSDAPKYAQFDLYNKLRDVLTQQELYQLYGEYEVDYLFIFTYYYEDIENHMKLGENKQEEEKEAEFSSVPNYVLEPSSSGIYVCFLKENLSREEKDYIYTCKYMWSQVIGGGAANNYFSFRLNPVYETDSLNALNAILNDLQKIKEK